jgi:hypothetical protein
VLKKQMVDPSCTMASRTTPGLLVTTTAHLCEAPPAAAQTCCPCHCKRPGQPPMSTRPTPQSRSRHVPTGIGHHPHQHHHPQTLRSATHPRHTAPGQGACCRRCLLAAGRLQVSPTAGTRPCYPGVGMVLRAQEQVVKGTTQHWPGNSHMFARIFRTASLGGGMAPSARLASGVPESSAACGALGF